MRSRLHTWRDYWISTTHRPLPIAMIIHDGDAIHLERVVAFGIK
jgi:hypothetical protein